MGSEKIEPTQNVNELSKDAVISSKDTIVIGNTNIAEPTTKVQNANIINKHVFFYKPACLFWPTQEKRVES